MCNPSLTIPAIQKLLEDALRDHCSCITPPGGDRYLARLMAEHCGSHRILIYRISSNTIDMARGVLATVDVTLGSDRIGMDDWNKAEATETAEGERDIEGLGLVSYDSWLDEGWYIYRDDCVHHWAVAMAEQLTELAA